MKIDLKNWNYQPWLIEESRGDMIEAFKMLNGHYDQDAIPKLQLSSNTNTRGNDKKLFMLSSKKNIRKFSFCVRIYSNIGIPYQMILLMLQA